MVVSACELCMDLSQYPLPTPHLSPRPCIYIEHGPHTGKTEGAASESPFP